MANEDKATRYHRLQRRASIIATLLVALTMTVLLVSGASASLRAIASDISRSSFLLTTLIYVTVVVLLSELVQLPLSLYQGVVLERRYGLSTQTTRRWWGDHLKGTLVATVLAIGGAWL